MRRDCSNPLRINECISVWGGRTGGEVTQGRQDRGGRGATICSLEMTPTVQHFLSWWVKEQWEIKGLGKGRKEGSVCVCPVLPRGDTKTGFCSCTHSYEPMGYIHIQKPQGVSSLKSNRTSHTTVSEKRDAQPEAWHSEASLITSRSLGCPGGPLAYGGFLPNLSFLIFTLISDQTC